jgi:cytochrome P450
MAINPDVTQRLRAEVLEHCGPSSSPTFENFRDMKYSALISPVNLVMPIYFYYLVKAVINETLRLFPPVPLNVRECRSTPCIFPQSDRTYPKISNQPLYMPPTTTITFFPLLMQRNAALWGDDADNFDPERWIDPKRMKKFVANPTMFTPFSAGPRIVSV